MANNHSQLRDLSEVRQSAGTRGQAENLTAEVNPEQAKREQEDHVWMYRTWRRLIWFAGTTTALLQTIAYRHQMNPDGISYLDIARACQRGNWHGLVNAYWSPLYPFLLSIVFRVFKPSPYWESTAAHLVNFGIFLLAFAAFEFLLAGIIRWERLNTGKAEPIPDWAMWALGDSLFFYLTLLLIQLGGVHPDMCVAAFVYLAAGLILRIQAGYRSWLLYVALGAVLGIAYLAKAVMFPLAFVFLACCLLIAKPWPRAWLRMALAVCAFVLTATPYVWALSTAKGRVTFGDVGKINYAEFVIGINRSIHWQGGQNGAGTPLHPTRMVLTSPPVFEFATPIEGTYPPWYDPSYWYDGVDPRFILRKQLRAIRYTIEEYASILPYMGALLTGFVGMLLCTSKPSLTGKKIRESWPLLIPSAAAFGLYGLLYVESRFAVPFFVLAWISLFGALRFAGDAVPRKIVSGITLGMVVTLGSGVVWLGGRAAFRALDPQPFVNWQVAEGLQAKGLRPGDRVASIGYSLDGYWAHLADVKIVAEVPLDGAPSFWAAATETQMKVLEIFAHTGAKVVVTDQRPPASSSEAWEEIGQTGYYVHDLNPDGTAPDKK